MTSTVSDIYTLQMKNLIDKAVSRGRAINQIHHFLEHLSLVEANICFLHITDAGNNNVLCHGELFGLNQEIEQHCLVIQVSSRLLFWPFQETLSGR